MNWQPIKTAPRDGRWIVVASWKVGNVWAEAARYVDGNGWMNPYWLKLGKLGGFTHWIDAMQLEPKESFSSTLVG